MDERHAAVVQQVRRDSPSRADVQALVHDLDKAFALLEGRQYKLEVYRLIKELPNLFAVMKVRRLVSGAT
jgi:hypothetical protein